MCLLTHIPHTTSPNNSVIHNVPSVGKQQNFFQIYTDDSTLQPSSSLASDSTNNITFAPMNLSVLLAVMLQRRCDNNNTSTTCTESFPEATGTAESIHLWAQEAFPHNHQQQRVFEILAAKFVLTYCSDAEKFKNNDEEVPDKLQCQYFHCKYLLQQMVGKPAKSEQLLMLVTGQAGSGKTEIIHRLLQYAQQYCSNIGQPFTNRTILVTACTAVTAALKNAETLHSATFLSKHVGNIDIHEKATFCNCVRMLVVHEVSMLTGNDTKTLSRHLNWLTDNDYGEFGNINIVFMGDFCQTLPIGKKPIYETKSTEF